LKPPRRRVGEAGGEGNDDPRVGGRRRGAIDHRDAIGARPLGIGRGQPKYGDDNGNVCAAGKFGAAHHARLAATRDGIRGLDVRIVKDVGAYHYHSGIRS
jgi:hypothetical protein